MEKRHRIDGNTKPPSHELDQEHQPARTHSVGEPPSCDAVAVLLPPVPSLAISPSVPPVAIVPISHRQQVQWAQDAQRLDIKPTAAREHNLKPRTITARSNKPPAQRRSKGCAQYDIDSALGADPAVPLLCRRVVDRHPLHSLRDPLHVASTQTPGDWLIRLIEGLSGNPRTAFTSIGLAYKKSPRPCSNITSSAGTSAHGKLPACLLCCRPALCTLG